VQLRRGELTNLFHSILILGTMVALLALIGTLLWGESGVLLLLVVATTLVFLNPAASGRLILRLNGGRPLSGSRANTLQALVRALAHRAGLPAPPRLFRIPGGAVTAFAVGTRRDSGIAVTDGLLRTLGPRELAGVLAHEVSHIRRNDVWVMGLAHLVGRTTHLMSVVGQILVLVNLPLLLMGSVAVPWSAVLLLILAPGVSTLLQLALSRTREYDADLGAARLTGDPVGLASGLARLERLNQGFLERFLAPGRRVPDAPFLRSHPRTQDRIRRLLRLEGDLEPVAEVERAVHDLSRPPRPRWPFFTWFPSAGV
jgi:heat shock protein HtpX